MKKSTKRTLFVAGGLAGLVGVVMLTPLRGVFGIRNTPEPDYDVRASDDDQSIEVRHYKPMLIARTQVTTDDYKKASEVGFRRLADYIFGSNKSSQNIGMTAPVFQQEERGGEQIGMTAPVLQQESGEGVWTTSFVMPERYTLESIPEPVDERIVLENVPEREVAVISFRGMRNPQRFEQNAAKLEQWLNQSAWQRAGEPRYAGYDPPFTLPMMRRNEILIEVRPRG